MQIARSKQFADDFVRLPRSVQKKVEKKLRFLVTDLRHPSIRARKISGAKDIWEGRIDQFYRFTFKIKQDTILLRRIGRHDETLKSP